MKSSSSPSIAGSALALSAWKRVLFSLAILTLLWLAIGWSVAIP
ncbi:MULTISPECIES: hypothetical protein [Pseudomonas syringae group]|uniref:ABC transporter permease n=1 Tax=Pseudomonas tremae TaxID=200454 RepID=A0ABV4PED1_9PSED|nr:MULTISPECIES: hypothetical protein [Pseudomonas syringae group]KPB49397.1 Uncharacterized protein AC511_1803 [Pseudomonas coronafaciens pv. oryzae]